MPKFVHLPFALPRSGFRGTEFYRLVPSPYKTHEALLEDTGGLRGKYLALAIGGIEPANGRGVRLTPARCVKWLALFATGFEAIRVDRNCWRFRVAGGPLVRQDEALRTAEAIGYAH